MLSLEVFLGSVGSVTRGFMKPLPSPLGMSARGDLPPQTPYGFGAGQPPPARPTLLRHSIADNEHPWGRNVDRLSIAYVLRPRLRSRLTLGEKLLPRKPQAFGGEDSHFSLRYLFRHSHFRYLHHSLRYGFTDLRKAPLPLHASLHTIRRFGSQLEPRYIFGARKHRPVSYYALF